MFLLLTRLTLFTVHSSDGLKLAIERTLSGVAALGIDCLFQDVGHYFDIDWSNTKQKRCGGDQCVFFEILCLSAMYLGIRLEEWIKLHRHLFRHPTIQASVIRNPLLVLHT